MSVNDGAEQWSGLGPQSTSDTQRRIQSGTLQGGLGVYPTPPKIQTLTMLSGYNPFTAGDVVILQGKAWIVSGFSSASGDPITRVHLKEVQ